jgi:hypothetical protein
MNLTFINDAHFSFSSAEDLLQEAPPYLREVGSSVFGIVMQNYTAFAAWSDEDICSLRLTSKMMRSVVDPNIRRISTWDPFLPLNVNLCDLSRWPNLKCIRIRNLHGSSHTACDNLSREPFPFLETLVMMNCSLDAHCVATFAAAPWASQLKSLDLGDNRLGVSALTELCSRPWPRLERLSLGKNCLDAEAMTVLTRGEFPCLKELCLCSSSIDMLGMAALHRARLPQLELLCLASNDLGDDAMELLAKCRFPALRHLLLNNNKITAASALSLARFRAPLQRLVLANQRPLLDASALLCFADAAWGSNIAHLDIAGCDAAIGELLISSFCFHNFGKLVWLNVGRNWTVQRSETFLLVDRGSSAPLEVLSLDSIEVELSDDEADSRS